MNPRLVREVEEWAAVMFIRGLLFVLAGVAIAAVLALAIMALVALTVLVYPDGDEEQPVPAEVTSVH